MIGQTVSHYRILEKLGEGGMGVVYRAEDTKLGRVVALKFLPPTLTSDAEAKERFVHEARAAAALDHPNICAVHEIDDADGQTFIAMAYVEGRSLKDRIACGPLKLEEAMDLALQVAEGLREAHEKGIVHRDIKPANIMITPKGQAKIMDFGLAKFRGQTALTKVDTTLGTFAYMSPEQARGEDVDHRTDIWSLGVVLHEMVTGQRPFKGDYEQAVIYSILNQEPEPLTGLRTGVPLEIERIVGKALAKDREERYQHAGDILADLRRHRKALEYSRAGYVRTSQMQEPPVERERTAPLKPKRTVLRFLIPAALIVAAIAVIAILNPFNFEIGMKNTAGADRKSVAILPFTNMSGNQEDEFFSDGITEDIIAQLSNIAELKVISRTSTMQYKNTGKNLRDIAKELNVATVLEGSVRRAGNQVRIVAQLIDAASDEHLWAQTYDKEMTQIFAIQSDVAQQIASALKAELTPQEKERVAKRPTESLDAYAYYLRGREYYYRYSRQDNEDAIELFKKALQLDPHYALAYAGLGDAYAQRVGKFGFPRAWVDSAIAVSSKAISTDPSLAEGYKALGSAYSGRGWIRKSLEAYRKAVEINPNYYPAVGNIGVMNELLGNIDEEMRWWRRSLALDPMFAFNYSGVGTAYLNLGDDARAEEWFKKARAVQPDFALPLLMLARVSFAQGEYERCIEQTREFLASAPSVYEIEGLDLLGSAELMLGDYKSAEEYFVRTIAVDSLNGNTAGLGFVYSKTGRQDAARRMFERSLRHDEEKLAQGNESRDVPYDLARVYAVGGNKEEAYRWLQKAIDAGWRDCRYGEIDPLLGNLRNDDRFKQMMADVRAKVDEMRKRVEELEKE